MLAELAAANAAFAVIKTALNNGKELADVAHKVSDYVNATEDLRQRGSKKKSRGTDQSLIEEFAALEALRKKEEELKIMMIYYGRPGLWGDWQRFQAQARKARQAEREARIRRRKQYIEYTAAGLLVAAILAGATALVKWVMFLKGLG